jgi:predicted transcriptional regulator
MPACVGMTEIYILGFFASQSSMKVSEIAEILDAEVMAGNHLLDRQAVAAGSADLMNDVLSAVAQDSVLLSGLTTQDVIRTAKIAQVAVVVFVRGKKPSEEILSLARTYDLPVLMTRLSLFVSSGRLYMNGLRGLNGSW